MKNSLCAHCTHAVHVEYGGFLCKESGCIENKNGSNFCDTFEPDEQTIRHGRWEKLVDGGYYCSQCQQSRGSGWRIYCSYCGAKMEGGEDDG